MPIQILVAVLVIVAGAYDILYRRIPNWLVLPAWLVGFIVNAYLAGWAGLGTAAKGWGLAMLVYFPLYLLRAMGAGDVKLMGAVGALVGPLAWFWVFVFSSLIGGLVALVLIVMYGRFRSTFVNLGFIIWELMHLRPPHRRSEELDVRSSRAFRLPHGAVIMLGVFLFLGALLFTGRGGLAG